MSSQELTRRIGLWGLPSSGKTVWLTSLAVNAKDGALDQVFNVTAVDSEVQEIVESWRHRLLDEQLWPLATDTTAHEGLPPLRFEYSDGNLRRQLVFNDFAGEWFHGLRIVKKQALGENERQSIIEFIQGCDCILVMVPFAEESAGRANTISSLDILLAALKSISRKDSRLKIPIALCVTCWDRSAESFGTLEQESARALEYMNSQFSEVLHGLKADCDDDCVSIFPISSTGHGEVLPDEKEPHARPPERFQAFNVIGPLSWALPQSEQVRFEAIKANYDRHRKDLLKKRSKKDKQGRHETHGEHIVRQLQQQVINRLPLDDKLRAQAEQIKKTIEDQQAAARRRLTVASFMVVALLLVVYGVVDYRAKVREANKLVSKELEQAEVTLNSEQDPAAMTQKIQALKRTLSDAKDWVTQETRDKVLAMEGKLTKRRDTLVNQIHGRRFAALEEEIALIPRNGISNLGNRIELFEGYLKDDDKSTNAQKLKGWLTEDRSRLNQLTMRKSEARAFEEWRKREKSSRGSRMEDLERRIEMHQDYLTRIQQDDMRAAIQEALNSDYALQEETRKDERFQVAVNDLIRQIDETSELGAVALYDAFLEEWGGTGHDKTRAIRERRMSTLREADENEWGYVQSKLREHNNMEALKAVRGYLAEARFRRHVVEAENLIERIPQKMDQELYEEFKEASTSSDGVAGSLSRCMELARAYQDGLHLPNEDKPMMTEVQRWMVWHGALTDPKRKHVIKFFGCKIKITDNGNLDIWEDPDIRVLLWGEGFDNKKAKTIEREVEEIGKFEKLPIPDEAEYENFHWSWGKKLMIEVIESDGAQKLKIEVEAAKLPFGGKNGTWITVSDDNKGCSIKLKFEGDVFFEQLPNYKKKQ